MDTKVCTKCGIEKPLSEFGTSRVRSKVYIKGKCKECLNDEKKTNYKNNEEQRIKARERTRRYNELHKDEIKEKRKEYFKEYRKKYYEENKEYYQEYKKSDKYKEQQLQYRHNNKEHIKEQNKKYKEKNHDIILEKRKKDDKKYRESHRDQIKKWKQDNIDLIRKERREYHKKRVQSDPLYKFEKQIRGLINSSFRRKKYSKNNHTYDIVGLEFNELYEYLLKTFKDNYGYDWDEKEDVHIDHIIPLAVATSEEEIISLCYYTNLQLLKAKDNLSKKDKLEWKLEE